MILVAFMALILSATACLKIKILYENAALPELSSLNGQSRASISIQDNGVEVCSNTHYPLKNNRGAYLSCLPGYAAIMAIHNEKIDLSKPDSRTSGDFVVHYEYDLGGGRNAFKIDNFEKRAVKYFRQRKSGFTGVVEAESKNYGC